MKFVGLLYGEEIVFVLVYFVLLRLEEGFVEGVVVFDDEVVVLYVEVVMFE